MDTTPNIVIELRVNRILLHIHSLNQSETKVYNSQNVTRKDINDFAQEYLQAGYEVSIIENKPYSM